MYKYIYIFFFFLKLVYKPLVSPAIPVVLSPSTSRQEEFGLFISRFHAACFYRSACDLPYFVRGVSMAGDVLVICSPNPENPSDSMTHFAHVLCVPYGSIITMVGKMSQFHLDVFRITRLVSTPPFWGLLVAVTLDYPEARCYTGGRGLVAITPASHFRKAALMFLESLKPKKVIICAEVFRIPSGKKLT